MNHHIALQVEDLARAVRFYEQAFDARIVTGVRRVGAPLAGLVMGGPAATEFAQCRLGFAAGCVELFQFLGEERPDWARELRRGRCPHFGVVVDDVEQAIARVESAGGMKLWPEIEEWGTAHTMYVSDVDGNVLELCDTPIEELIEILNTMFASLDRSHARC